MADLFVETLMSLPGAVVQAVAARTQERASEFAARYGIARAFEGYHRVLDDPAVDLVYVATPNELHSEHCSQALSRGKAVLCEKPFALTAAKAREVVNLARSRGIFCMEAMWMRFAPAVRAAVDLAKSGKLGSVHFFSGALGFSYENAPESRLFRQPGGGALLDLGVYPLSLAQALFGSPDRVISSVELAPTGVDAQFAAILSYKGGAQAQIAASLNAKLGNSATIHGRDGTLQLDEPLYFPERYRLFDTAFHTTKPRRLGKLAKLRRYPLLRSVADLRKLSKAHIVSTATRHSGYSFEAEEAQRCLRSGLTESPEMPWNDTLAVLESIDSIRSEWSARLPS
jgi:predicted dehydrogenase